MPLVIWSSFVEVLASGEDIEVDGYMAAAKPSGCRLARSRFRAVCPVAGADAIEVDMGPSGDLVEVLNRMPFPLTAHLGAGEDKFIGNGEKDTCYPEGTRRNRCVCYMGPGEDGCHGGPGNDRLFGGPGADQLYGGPGFDYCDGGPGIGKSHECEAGPGH